MSKELNVKKMLDEMKRIFICINVERKMHDAYEDGALYGPYYYVRIYYDRVIAGLYRQVDIERIRPFFDNLIHPCVYITINQERELSKLVNDDEIREFWRNIFINDFGLDESKYIETVNP